MSNLGLKEAMLAALAVGAVFLIAYQVFMIYWTRKTVGALPRPVLVLRVLNMVLLVGASALVIWQLARG